MKFNHVVKCNGKFYPAGTDVPMLDDEKSINEESCEADETIAVIDSVEQENEKEDVEPAADKNEKVKTSGKVPAKK